MEQVLPNCMYLDQAHDDPILPSVLVPVPASTLLYFYPEKRREKKKSRQILFRNRNKDICMSYARPFSSLYSA